MLESFLQYGFQAAVWTPLMTVCFVASEAAHSPDGNPGLDIYSFFKPKYIFW